MYSTQQVKTNSLMLTRQQNANKQTNKTLARHILPSIHPYNQTNTNVYLKC